MSDCHTPSSHLSPCSRTSGSAETSISIGVSTSARGRSGARVSPPPAPAFSLFGLSGPKPTFLERREALRLLVVLAVAALLLAGCAADAPATAPTFDTSHPSNATVEKVVDGDTIEVTIGRRREKVRLIGIDTPETVDPRRPAGCFGVEASTFTKDTLPAGTEVRLELDVEPRDRYRRLLAYVHRSRDGLFVNAELIDQGFAQPLTIPPNIAYTDKFVDLAAEARRQNRGLWGQCPPEPQRK